MEVAVDWFFASPSMSLRLNAMRRSPKNLKLPPVYILQTTPRQAVVSLLAKTKNGKLDVATKNLCALSVLCGKAFKSIII